MHSSGVFKYSRIIHWYSERGYLKPHSACVEWGLLFRLFEKGTKLVLEKIIAPVLRSIGAIGELKTITLSCNIVICKYSVSRVMMQGYRQKLFSTRYGCGHY